MLAISFESKNTPSVIALSRQGINPVRKKIHQKKNKSAVGAYEILRTETKSKLTILPLDQKQTLQLILVIN